MTYQLGIDLGTTYSAAAILRDREVAMVSLGTHTLELPSVVFLRADGEFLVGEAADRRGQADPGRLAREFKRRIGDPVPILLAGSPHSAQALTARLLRWIVDAVATREGGPPTRIVVTHPANWGPFKQNVLLQAIQLADVPNVRLAPEPLAAAVHYASTTRVSPGDIVAVYDLGGGTFDAAVLRKTMEWFEVLGRPEGIEHLGGIDFDEAVLGYVTRGLGDQLKLDRGDPAAVAGMARLRRECVEAKEVLSVDSDVSIPVLLPGLQTEIRLSRGEFEGMIRPAIGETINALRRTLRSADVEPDALKAVVLVGGSGRIPLVGELVQAEFGVPISIDVHPKHAVAMGAARMAGVEALPTPVVKPLAPTAETAPVTAPPTPEQPDSSSVAEWAPPAPPASTGGQQESPGPPPAPAEPARGAVPPPFPPANGESTRSRRRLLVGAGTAVLIVATAAALLTRGGGDGGGTTTTESASVTATPNTDDVTTSASAESTVPSTGTSLPVTGVPVTGEPVAADVVLFSTLRSGNFDIYAITVEGTEEHPLVEGVTEDLIPLWSPDRRSMAYTRGDKGAAAELWIAAADGSSPELVSDAIQPATRAAWSPDGTRLAFISAQGGVLDVWIIDLSTRELQRVTDDPVEEGDPTWSPAGDFLAVWRNIDGNIDLWTIEVGASSATNGPGALTRITDDPASDSDPSWSSEGDRIAFTSDRAGNSDVYVVGGRGGPVTRLTNDPANEGDPSWSPDGRSIAFSSERDGGDREIYVMDDTGANQQRITNSLGFDGLPAWGPFPASG